MADDGVPELNLKSADDLLAMNDTDLVSAFGLTAPKGEEVDTDDPLKLNVPLGEVKAGTGQEGVITGTTEAPPKVAAPDEVAAPTPDEVPPEGEPKEPAPKPVAEFQVYDGQGELEVPPDLTLTFKSNGKVRENVPLDRVVRLAQMGDYNQEREDQVLAAKRFVAESQTQLQELQTQVQQYEAWYGKVLADEDFYRRAQDDYARQNSPDARVERAERQLHEERSRHQREAEVQQAAAFVQTTLVPVVTKLIEEHPTVPFEELMGRYNLLIAPYMVRGQVPIQSLPSVQRLVDVELTNWVKALHQSREFDRQRHTNQVAAAQTQSQLAKRQLARATQPAPTGTPAAPKPTTWKSADEWLEAALPVPQS